TVTDAAATVSGTVNPNGAPTTAAFEYGLTSSYGNRVDATPAPGSGVSPVIVGAFIANLEPNQTYHYRVSATNQAGTSSGTNGTFTTGGTPPAVTTTSASNITATGATLRGTVNANGFATTAAFEYGLTTT